MCQQIERHGRNRYNFTRLKQEERKNLRGLISSNDIETIIKNNLILILLKIFHKIKEEEMLPNFIHEASITLLPKPKHYTNKQ